MPASRGEPAGRIRQIPFAGALNFRDIGGYPVAGGNATRWNLIYRSDSLHYLTTVDLPAFDALGIATIYDLRRPAEVEQFPGPRAYVRHEIPSRDLGQEPTTNLATHREGEEWLLADYLGMLAVAAPSFGRLFAGFARAERLPAVVHCFGGKDRTGLAIALLLTALGVDRATVLDDYELTSVCTAARRPQVVDLFVASGIARPTAEGLLGTPRWVMAAALAELDDAYGGIDRYLLGPCGMDGQTLNTLRSSLADAGGGE